MKTLIEQVSDLVFKYSASLPLSQVAPLLCFLLAINPEFVP